MEKLRDKLLSLQDLEYKDFVAKLIPTIDPSTIIGIRTPVLKTVGKELAKSELKELFLRSLPHAYYEENNLHAMLLQNISTDMDEEVKHVEAFLPYINNWATCDSTKPKAFGKHIEQLRQCIERWISSSHTYTVRYGIVTLMNFCLDKEFQLSYLKMIGSIKSDEYYINMAIAWYYSFAFIKQYESTVAFFQSTDLLDKWVYNKAIQKGIESLRLTADQKDFLRSLKKK